MTTSKKLLFIFMFITSCNQEEVTIDKYCSNQRVLFSASDNLETVTINFSDSNSDIMDFLESTIKKDFCWNEVSFGLTLKNGNTIKVFVINECWDGIIRCFRKFPRQILLNEQGDLMIENDLIPIDSTKGWIKNNFLSEEYGLKQLSLQWHMSSPYDSIQKVFSNIIDGYLQVYEEMSKDFFGKKTCDLHREELNFLSNKLPFKLKLEIGRRPNILPPLKDTLI